MKNNYDIEFKLKMYVDRRLFLSVKRVMMVNWANLNTIPFPFFQINTETGFGWMTFIKCSGFFPVPRHVIWYFFYHLTFFFKFKDALVFEFLFSYSESSSFIHVVPIKKKRLFNPMLSLKLSFLCIYFVFIIFFSCIDVYL